MPEAQLNPRGLTREVWSVAHGTIIGSTTDQWEQKAGQRDSLTFCLSTDKEMEYQGSVGWALLGIRRHAVSPWRDVTESSGEVVEPSGEYQDDETGCNGADEMQVRPCSPYRHHPCKYTGPT